MDVSRSNAWVPVERLRPEQSLPGSRDPSQKIQRTHSFWSARSLVKGPGHKGRVGAGEGAKTASQTGGEGKPGDKVSGTRVREASKVPGRAMGFTSLGLQSLLWGLAPSFLMFKRTEALSSTYPGTPSLMLCPCARVEQWH